MKSGTVSLCQWVFPIFFGRFSGSAQRKAIRPLSSFYSRIQRDAGITPGFNRLTHPTAGYSFLGHEESVLGGTGAMYWHEKEDTVVVILTNVGTMHIGQRLARAYSTVRNTDFIEQAVKYAHTNII